MKKVHGFLPLIQSYVGRFELRLPGQWTASTADGAETNPINMAKAAGGKSNGKTKAKKGFGGGGGPAISE